MSRWRRRLELVMTVMLLSGLTGLGAAPRRAVAQEASPTPAAALTPTPVSASPNELFLRLEAPDLTAFPILTTFLDVRRADGTFVRGLTPDQVQVNENGQPLAVSALEAQRPGVQIVTAINPGPTFANNNSQGLSRLESIAAQLEAWAKSRQGSTVDDWSLMTSRGAAVSHTRSSLEWLSALQSYVADPGELRAALPQVATLFTAVNLAAEAPPQPGMQRAVLLITAPLEGDLAASLDNVIASAQAAGVHVFIWLVTPPGTAADIAAERLAPLAVQTGGSLLTTSGDEVLPDPESFLDTLRNVYQLTYASAVRASGETSFAVTVQTSSAQAVSPAQTFAINLQPPNPAFVAPAREITRQLPPEAESQFWALDEIPPSAYAPQQAEVNVLVTFPDGRPRPLTRTALLVDGAVAAENTAPPFETFTWDLLPYVVSGEHLLQVVATDELGQTGASIETAVQITVEKPQTSPWLGLYRNRRLLAGLAAVVLAAIALLALLLSGRIQPATLRAHKRVRPRPSEVGPPSLSAPVSATPSRPDAAAWPQKRAAPQAEAFLTRLVEADQPAPDPIPLTAEEITLGSSPLQSTLVLDDPALEARHARLTRGPEGRYRLLDESTLGGVYVNLTPVGPQGTELQAGDSLYLGQTVLRFSLRRGDAARRPLVAPDPWAAPLVAPNAPPNGDEAEA